MPFLSESLVEEEVTVFRTKRASGKPRVGGKKASAREGRASHEEAGVLVVCEGESD